MVKKVQSELQLAADRIREMQVAVETSKSNLQECQIAYSEAMRNLKDAEGLLRAQEEKLQRELQVVKDIIGYDQRMAPLKEFF